MKSKQQPPIQPIPDSPRGSSKSPVNELNSPSWINYIGHFDLASPFELAQIAISLSVMKGETEPDLEGAFRMIQDADFHIQIINDAAKEEEDLERAEKDKDLHLQEVVDVLLKEPIEFHNTFPGSDKIKAPKRFPASTTSCWRALLGRSPSKKEIEGTLKQLIKSNSKLKALAKYRPCSEVTFWWWAKWVVPHMNRFAKFYNKTPTRNPRKRNKNKQFATKKKTEEGKFANKNARNRK